MSVEVSVIIPFRDWGLTRLRLAIETALASAHEISAEVVVSDYGTDLSNPDFADLPRITREAGAVYVRTEEPGPWSRSRALNAGAAVATGDYLVASDADMLMPPGCLDAIPPMLADGTTFANLSCFDLPRAWDDQAVAALETIDWQTLRDAAHRRPRWGMGLVAASRTAYETLRGWDERFVTYGGEDNDFSARLRRAGYRVVWPEDPRWGLLHMWHSPTSAKHALSAEDEAQIKQNKEWAKNDLTHVRNLTQWQHPLPNQQPAVSVVISTYNRRRMLQDAVNSILAQTIQDFEIIIVDDGSTDDTEQWATSLTDPRIRYVKQENAGISAARNHGSRLARGRYTAVLDDDDIALPWRLAVQFEAMTVGIDATCGGFVNFDDVTGELRLYVSKEMNEDTTLFTGAAPGHSTWMVRTDLMRAIGYDENLTSGVDNDMALRLLRSGVRWKHTRHVHVLRRVHPGGVTVKDLDRQLANAASAYKKLTFGYSQPDLVTAKEQSKKTGWPGLAEKDSVDSLLVKYLPDHLVRRAGAWFSTCGAPEANGAFITYADGRTERWNKRENLTWQDIADAAGTLDESYIEVSALDLVESPPVTPAALASMALSRSGLQQTSPEPLVMVEVDEDTPADIEVQVDGDRLRLAVHPLSSFGNAWTLDKTRVLVPTAHAQALALKALQRQETTA